MPGLIRGCGRTSRTFFRRNDRVAKTGDANRALGAGVSGFKTGYVECDAVLSADPTGRYSP